MPHDFQNDIDAIQRIAAVPTILDVVCRATGMGFAAVARVTEERWVACQVLDHVHFGLSPGGELKVETTLCHEIRQHRQIVAIDNVTEDPTYSSHHTPQIYGLQSYISVPIVLPDGRFFGTLCAIDPNPHEVNNPQIIGTFTLFAELIAYHLDAEDRINIAETKVNDGQAFSDLREQFIAVLGHDLRNPLAGLEGGRRVLAAMHDDPKSVRVLRLMGESVARMSGLIDNLMDFARGRLGGGIGLQRVADQRLEPLLAQIINEIKAGHPEREIKMHFDMPHGVEVDPARIGQMFSNLLGNAVTHGAQDVHIVVESVITEGRLILSVANGGQPIPDTAMDRLFQPFHRGDGDKRFQGLGLGLYIASQIAEAHGGTIEAKSNAEETRFTFTMPV